MADPQQSSVLPSPPEKPDTLDRTPLSYGELPQENSTVQRIESKDKSYIVYVAHMEKSPTADVLVYKRQGGGDTPVNSKTSYVQDFGRSIPVDVSSEKGIASYEDGDETINISVSKDGNAKVHSNTEFYPKGIAFGYVFTKHPEHPTAPNVTDGYDPQRLLVATYIVQDKLKPPDVPFRTDTDIRTSILSMDDAIKFSESDAYKQRTDLSENQKRLSPSSLKNATKAAQGCNSRTRAPVRETTQIPVNQKRPAAMNGWPMEMTLKPVARIS